eukprot:19057_1
MTVTPGSDVTKPQATKTYNVEADRELRFEVDKDTVLTVTLKSGLAEMYGIELPENTDMNFTGTKGAIFTWHGCTLETKGGASVAYVGDGSAMTTYMNVHAQLEHLRKGAQLEASTSSAPRVLVVGPRDSGKATICNILSAYAVRQGRRPVFVDLDPGFGRLAMPGTLLASVLDSTVMSAEGGYSLASPLVYWYGHPKANENQDLFKHLTTKLAESVEKRLENFEQNAYSGAIIKFYGWVEVNNLEMLKHCMAAFGVNVVLVVENESLYSALSSNLPELQRSGRPRDITIVKVPKSGGVVQRSAADAQDERRALINSYFYGSKNVEWEGSGPTLSPTLITVRFDDICICRCGGEELHDGLLPVGQAALLGSLRMTRVQPTKSMSNSILAVYYPPTSSSDDIGKGNELSMELGMELLEESVACFVFVSQVDVERRWMTLLCPCLKELPSKYLLTGSIKWIE